MSTPTGTIEGLFGDRVARGKVSDEGSLELDFISIRDH